MQSILVCDDDKQIVEAIDIYLTGEGFEVIKAYDGAEALELLKTHTVNLMILDVMMPGLDGIRTTLKVRETSSIPIIILSAKSEDADKILGLNIGADDYITKPFNPLELVARVKSQLRRYTQLGNMNNQMGNHVFKCGGLQINDENKEVTVDGELIKLTPIEYNILLLLVKNQGGVAKFKTKLSHIPMQIQKWIASLAHLFFLILGLIGISLMYINGNFGLGLTGIGSVPYEDTAEFNTQFNNDLNDIFLYMEYQDVFGADSSIDLSRRMLKMTFGPSETENFSLSSLISYLESMGYQLDDDFNCQKVSEPADGVKSREGYVEWSVQEPQRIYSYRSASRKRSTLEDAAVEIMDTLHRYYTVYNRFVANPSNLHFKIQYTEPDSDQSETTQFTNTDSLTPENVKEYGRYAYLPGNSVFYDTNMKAIPLSSISALASNNPYTGSDYYLLIGIDTNYPVTDLYARTHTAYLHRQHLYLTGFALTIFATIGLLLSFLFLFRVSGYQSYRSFDVTLHGFDKSGTETGIVFFAAMTAIALVVSDLILIRILHLVIPSQYWYFSDHSLQALVLYLGGLLLFFSLLRRYRAGTLWTSSLICRIQKKMLILKTRQNFRSRLGIGFVLYLAINTALISLAWYFWDRVYASLYVVYLLTGLTVLVFLLFNLWIFYILFRQAIEQESIRDAVQQLSTGETSYQLNLDEFDGPELTLAEGLNNISSGLETALQEKMKSERLKTNLITNVSHDIKTPLTSIINYVNLMKREHIEDARINAYLDVLDQKSQRLKTLIEDLV